MPLIADNVPILIFNPHASICILRLTYAIYVYCLNAAVRVFALLELFGMNLALLVWILDGLVALRVNFEHCAIGQARLLATVLEYELADFVGKDDLASVVDVLLLHLAVRKLGDLETVGVYDLHDFRFGVVVGLRAGLVVDFLAIAVEELDQSELLVGAQLLESAVVEYGEYGAVFE